MPDPFADASLFVESLGAAVAPRLRVLSISPRAGVPYQVAAVDLLGVLQQFGFSAPVVVAERLGCVVVLALAAWYPRSVGALILVDAQKAAPPDDTREAYALRDSPLDLTAVRQRIQCPVFEASSVEDVLRRMTALP